MLIDIMTVLIIVLMRNFFDGALYEKLERCLWRFSMENGGSGDFYPILNRVTREWSIISAESQRFGPSFKTREACARAIKEVIKPMLDGIA